MLGPSGPEAASAKPNTSPSSAVLPTPDVFWVKNWLPVPVNPAARPRSTLTAPIEAMLLDSNGTPTPRSAKPSPLKSPDPSANPKKSPSSEPPPTPGEFWVKNPLPVPVNPAALPGSTLTAPTAKMLLDSIGTPTPRSANPSWLKSPDASALPNESPASAALPTPGVSWVKNWLPVAVSPAAPPNSRLTAPASSALPTDSNGTPTAKSAKPSLLKSPDAKALPNESLVSAVSVPDVSWVKNWLPVGVSPAALPYRTLTAPASRTLPTDSNGTPMARSAKPSLLKSPTVSVSPNESCSSPVSAPDVSWVKNWLPVPVNPAARPYSTLTAPASVALPTDSPGTPTARSAKPSSLKSAC